MLTLLLKMISRVPFAALYFVADTFYLLNKYIIHYRYDVVRSNLKNAFPDRSERDLNLLTEEIFRNLADVLVETIKGIAISREELEQRMEIKIPEAVQELINQGKALIFLSAHFGNWEWLYLYSCIYLPHPLLAAYQPFHNQRFDDFMLNARTRFGGTTVPATDLIKQTVKQRKTMKTLELLVDQTPAGNERKYWTTFLNQDTAFIDGTDSLAWLTGMPVVFVTTKRRKRGHYEVSLKLIAEPPYEKNDQVVVERYARELEATILSDPSGWLWTHRRWKLSRPAGEDDS